MIEWIKRVWRGEFEYDVDRINEYYDNSIFWESVKYHLCSPESGIANILYLFYGDLDCNCCAFIRGLVLGVTITLCIGAVL